MSEHATAPAALTAILALAEPPERPWLSACFATASADLLGRFEPADVLAAARRHRELARSQPPPAGLVDLDRDGPGGCLRVFTVCPDRPFLVDTVQLVLRRQGARILGTFHPLLRLRRARGMLPELAETGPRESLIQVLAELPGGEARDRAVAAQLVQALDDLRLVVEDFAAMTTRCRERAEELRRHAPEDAECIEAAAFLDWLVDGHFTFLGAVATRVDPERAAGFEVRPETALGLARPGRAFADTDALIAPKAELDKYVESRRVVVVTKALVRAPVHHDEILDVISVKQFGPDGSLLGTLRLFGLFTTDVYLERPRHIPLLRQRVLRVIERAGLIDGSHAAKQLRDTLAMLPRDELWQSSDEELYALAQGVLALRERHELRLFLRRDRYGRFFSALIYLPRQRYGRELRDRLVAALVEALGGSGAERSVEFPRSSAHARLQVLVHTPAGTAMPEDVPAIEARLLALTRTWGEQLRAELSARPEGASLAERYEAAFEPAYTAAVSPAEAVADLVELERLSADAPRRVRLPVAAQAAADTCFTELRLYSRGAPAALSEMLPVLEHFGLFVSGQRPYRVTAQGREPAYLQVFQVRAQLPCAGTPTALAARFEAAFHALLDGAIEDDPLNALVLAGLEAREVVILRLLVRYLVQTGLPYSQAFMERQLLDAPEVARGLVAAFTARHDPRLQDADRAAAEAEARSRLQAAIDALPSLDADRILRAAASVVAASLRSNFFLGKPVVSLKLDPKQIPELPLPRPAFEIYVYAPHMEGVHLRMGPVARGGLRWSDRPQDFRTEVLGLVKAQQVKNSIIVPVGAKGGFVVKRGDRQDREAWAAAGRAAYVDFLCGLLELTDNRCGERTVPPEGVVCHDAPDPYLVVAADKGTATFSDLANETAARYGFWLGDAFASGGSQGYDHKKMGITARGAWECVKRHFREQGRDIQSEPFTVVGIGDMSGDVFGNGMLLSRQIRLIAAFDHRHIFIDPDPDAAVSFAERERLFALPRSSWADYDPAKLSPGGGVYPRTAKLIRLSPQAQAVLEAPRAELSPTELLRLILKAPVDLLWNGGIGTYVKASHESHAEVGDRANDAIRINGRELRAKVVGEGGNLGFTQAGRIEYALAGGAINTDAIDNAGGVHSSDREVNIKIPLNGLMQAGQLDRATRDPLLVRLTDDLARAVLRDNQVQSGALTLMALEASERLDEHANLLRKLEREGRIDRAVDGLPDEEGLTERRRRGLGFTRPELAVLLAHTKITLFDDLVASSVVDDPWFEHDLLAYFPRELVAHYRPALVKHQLRREIIATVLANGVCNRMGAPFIHRVSAELGVGRAVAVHAWAAAHAIVDADRFWAWLDEDPPRFTAEQQRTVSLRVAGLLKHLCRGLLTRPDERLDVAALLARYRPWVQHFDRPAWTAGLPPDYAADHARAVAALVAQGFAAEDAETLARTRLLGVIPDLVHLGEATGADLDALSALYFELGERFHLPWLHEQLNALRVAGRWPALARGNLRDDLYRIQAGLCAAVLRSGAGADPAASLARWSEARAEAIRFTRRRLDALQADSGDDFMRLVVAARELYRLTQ